MNISSRVAAALCLIIAASVESVGPFFLLHVHSWTSPLSNPKPGWVYLECRCPQRQRHTCLLIQTRVYLKPWLTRFVLICAETESVRTQFRNPEIRRAVSSYSATQSLARPLKSFAVVLMVSWILLFRLYADMTNACHLRRFAQRKSPPSDGLISSTTVNQSHGCVPATVS